MQFTDAAGAVAGVDWIHCLNAWRDGGNNDIFISPMTADVTATTELNVGFRVSPLFLDYLRFNFTDAAISSEGPLLTLGGKVSQQSGTEAISYFHAKPRYPSWVPYAVYSQTQGEMLRGKKLCVTGYADCDLRSRNNAGVFVLAVGADGSIIETKSKCLTGESTWGEPAFSEQNKLPFETELQKIEFGFEVPPETHLIVIGYFSNDGSCFAFKGLNASEVAEIACDYDKVKRIGVRRWNWYSAPEEYPVPLTLPASQIALPKE